MQVEYVILMNFRNNSIAIHRTVVYGFTETNLTLEESAETITVRVEQLKGPGQLIAITPTAMPGTAGTCHVSVHVCM